MRDIWTRSLESLQSKLPRAHYDDLVRSVVCSRVDSHTVTLQVCGRVQRDWIVEHYLELLGRELEIQAGHSLSIDLEIAPRRDGRTRKSSSPSQSRPQAVPAPGGTPLLGPRAASRTPLLLPAGRARVAPRAGSSPPPSSPEAAPPQATRSAAAAAVDLPTVPTAATAELPSCPSFPAKAETGSSTLLNARYTLSTFVVGPSNQMAHAACVGICQRPGRLYNPLFLYGSSGLGKTHLLQAVGHRLLQEQPGRQVVLRSTEDFINDFTRSLRQQHMDSFRRFYREQCDLLLLDDVQFMSGKEQTQQEFFHTFEALLQRGSQIVMTSDRLPREIDRLDERLRSRFTWGLLADIQVPELETRIAILQQKAEMAGLLLDDEVALFLADSFRSNIRELEGTLTRLCAYATLLRPPRISLEFVQEVLRDHLPRSRKLTIEDAIKLVADFYRIRPADLKGARRHRNVARPRQVAMFLVREVMQRSFPEIGRAFGKDHTTVISACRKVEDLLRRDTDLGQEVESLKRRMSEG